MIRYELLRMLRNRKWKYLIPAALLAYIYISGVSSFTVTEGSIYQDQQIQAAACLVSFLFLSIVYQIAWEEEPPLSWQVLLAFPLTCRKSYLCKLCILLLFQLPAAAIGIGVYAVIQKSIASPFLTFLLCIQLLYLTGFLYGCYKTSQGYLAAMGTITIINVTKRLVPVFIIFCMLNGKAWSAAFAILWPLILLFCLSVIIGLWILLPVCMRRKLHQEMVLSKLFPNLKFTPGQLMLMQYRKGADRLLQFIFRKCDTHSRSYWKRCAVIEVSIKLYAFSFALLLFFLAWFMISLNLLILMAAVICLLHVIYCLCLESRTMHAVCIKDTGHMQRKRS